MATSHTNLGDLAAFRVKLTPTPVPLYMVVDLRLDSGAAGQIEYIYPGDARLETYGYWTNVWFGVTNDAIYATDKLVMRRVRAGAYKAGFDIPPKIDVTISKDFYVGVFSLTVGQYNRVTGASGGTLAQPKGLICYDAIRGSTNDQPAVNWPLTGSYVNPTSFLGLVRAKTRFPDFDLPTCAQREYFCRAGTASYYNDGESTSFSTNILDRLAWWVNNAGVSLWPVGLLEANHWGLYDTLGNVYEWCLNWGESGETPVSGTDPKGPESGTKRRLMVLNRAGSVSGYRPSYGHAMAPTNAATASASFRLIRALR